MLHAVQHLTRDATGFLAFMREAQRILDEGRAGGDLVTSNAPSTP
jgi:hypothetical protein